MLVFCTNGLPVSRLGGGYAVLGRCCGLSWEFFELQKDTSKILQKHSKIQCFGALRVQNGAKKGAKSELFGGWKILQKPGKIQGLGVTHPTRNMSQKWVLCFFVENMFFHNPCFSLCKTIILGGQGTNFSLIFNLFFTVFLGNSFYAFFIKIVKTIVKYKVFGPSGLLCLLKKCSFLCQKMIKINLETKHFV